MDVGCLYYLHIRTNGWFIPVGKFSFFIGVIVLYVVVKLRCITSNEVVVSRTKFNIGSSDILGRDAISLSRGTPPLSKTNNWPWCEYGGRA